MKIEAISTIIDHDNGQMVVINVGEIGELTDAKAQRHIEAGTAKLADADPLDHDGDGEAGGSIPNEPPALTGKNKAQLLEIAGAEGVEVVDGATNADIIAAIEAKRVADELADAADDEAPAA